MIENHVGSSYFCKLLHDSEVDQALPKLKIQGRGGGGRELNQHCGLTYINIMHLESLCSAPRHLQSSHSYSPHASITLISNRLVEDIIDKKKLMYIAFI